MTSPKDYIQTNRAALFDWLVIFISFSLGLAFPALSDFIRSPGFFNWMLTALLLYIAGAALKDLPLSHRLSFRAGSPKPVPYVLFLVIGHWLIMFFLVILAEPAIRKLLQLPALTDDNAASWQLMLGATVLATFVTWLVYRSKSNRKKRKNHSPGFLFRMELVADLLLIAAVSIFSFVFWEKGVMGMLGRASTRTIGDIWFLFIFLSILFLFFYLPLRYLFLIENREGGSNRKRLFLIFGFILLKALFEMLNI